MTLTSSCSVNIFESATFRVRKYTEGDIVHVEAVTPSGQECADIVLFDGTFERLREALNAFHELGAPTHEVVESAPEAKKEVDNP